MIAFHTTTNAIDILPLYQSAIAPITQQSLQTLLDQKSSICTLITQQQKPIGFALSQTASDQADMIAIAVEEHIKRIGLGTKLLNAHETALKEKNVTEYFLEVRRSNIAAIAFYEKNNATIISTRTAYYSKPDGSKEDAIIMKKEIV